MTNRFILLVLLSLTLGSAIGCRSTAEGFGKDMERNGEKIQEKTR